MPLEACIAAIDQLQAPDKWSRTKDHEGRRIVEVDGGWRVLNYQNIPVFPTTVTTNFGGAGKECAFIA